MEASTPLLAEKIYRFFRTHGAKKTMRRAMYVCHQNTITRFLEWQFDRRFHVQTGGLYFFSDKSASPRPRFDYYYEATSPRLFRKVLHLLGPLATPFSFYDMGCGKGRVLMMAAQHGFHRVVGVEFDSELYKTAVANMASFRARYDCKSPVEVVHGDAAEFQFPDEDSVIFFFNPFPEPVMRRVLKSIRRSAINTKYRYIVYNNPVHASLFDSPHEFELVVKKKEFAIYRMRL
jgi:SAM-dependent methyltransferase